MKIMRNVLTCAEIRDLRARYDDGEEMLAHPRDRNSSSDNTSEMFLLTYDVGSDPTINRIMISRVPL